MDRDSTRLIVVDGTNIFYRAYHGMAHQAFEFDGQATFAVYGTINTLARTVRSHPPTHAVVVFDWGKSAYRLQIWPKYKAGRPESAVIDRDDSDSQMTIVQDLIPQFGLSVWREKDIEADDLIATIVGKFKLDVDEIVLITGDKDMRQLADENVIVLHPSIGAKPEQRWDRHAVLAHYGVTPDRLPEVWALSGDKIDNIPGVPGIGEKTAIKLIRKYGSLSGVSLSDEKKIEGYRHDMNMSLSLVQLNASLSSFPLELDNVCFIPATPTGEGSKELRASLNNLGFDSLVSRWVNGSLWFERGLRLRDLKQQHQ